MRIATEMPRGADWLVTSETPRRPATIAAWRRLPPPGSMLARLETGDIALYDLVSSCEEGDHYACCYALRGSVSVGEPDLDLATADRHCSLRWPRDRGYEMI